METNQRLPRALWPVLRAGTSVFQEAVNFRYFEIKRILIYHKSCYNTLLTERPQACSVLKEKKEGGEGGEGLKCRQANLQGHIALGQDGEKRLDLRQSICEQLTDQE